MKLLSIQRREAIRELLLEHESVTVNQLIEKFGVSVETVRRDLEILSEEGFLNKVYGGATLKNRTSAIPPRKLLQHTFEDEKERIAARAVRFMKPGDTIFLDQSTDVFNMCKGLLNMNITVLSNSLPVLNYLSKSQTIGLISVGGRYCPTYHSFEGPMAIDFLKKFQVDKAFFSCKSFDMDRGLSSYSEQAAEMSRTIIDCAEHTCLLVDHSKFGKVSFAHICGFEKIECLFTDRIIDDNWRAFFTAQQVKVFECPENPEDTKDWAHESDAEFEPMMIGSVNKEDYDNIKM